MLGGHATRSPAFEAVVTLGNCSAVLVEPDLLLTSAHCLEARIDQLAIGGRSVRIAACYVSPRYRPVEWPADIGVCRLTESVSVTPLAIDDVPAPIQGDPVTLVGRGLDRAFAAGRGTLRVVETSVAGVGPSGIYVGTSDRTACRGDSGGPVLVERQGVFRVAAIIHGGSGAICASSAEAVVVRPHLQWIAETPRGGTDASREGAIAGRGVVLVVGLMWAWRWARMRFRRRTSASSGNAGSCGLRRL